MAPVHVGWGLWPLFEACPVRPYLLAENSSHLDARRLGPDSLTSCPELDTVNLHIRIVGDWTEALAEACGMHVLTFKLNVG